jgi:hypothetical protein
LKIEKVAGTVSLFARLSRFRIPDFFGLLFCPQVAVLSSSTLSRLSGFIFPPEMRMIIS